MGSPNSLPKPAQWLFDLFRRPMARQDLKKAYDRACIWASDCVRYDEGRRSIALQPQARGGRPGFIRQISQWIGEVNAAHADTNNPPSADLGDWARLMGALQPAGQQPGQPDDPGRPPPCIPFTQAELESVYGQGHPPDVAGTGPASTEWEVYTDGSVAQRNGRTMGTFAGTFTSGLGTPADFQGRVLELPLSSTRMEIMAIMTAIAITPSSVPLKIHTDSQAAAHMMDPCHGADRDPRADQLARRLPLAPPPELDAVSLGASDRDLGQGTLGRRRQRGSRSPRSLGPRRPAGSTVDDTDAAATRDGVLAAAHHAAHRRVIPRRPRRLLREQDETITSEQLVKQVNAVPDRPIRSPRPWWRSSCRRSSGRRSQGGRRRGRSAGRTPTAAMRTCEPSRYKLLVNYLPTLARQHAWYPHVYNRPELIQCAKCGHTPETQDARLPCADHAEAERHFRDSYLVTLLDRPVRQGAHAAESAGRFPAQTVGLAGMAAGTCPPALGDRHPRTPAEQRPPRNQPRSRPHSRSCNRPYRENGSRAATAATIKHFSSAPRSRRGTCGVAAAVPADDRAGARLGTAPGHQDQADARGPRPRAPSAAIAHPQTAPQLHPFGLGPAQRAYSRFLFRLMHGIDSRARSRVLEK